MARKYDPDAYHNHPNPIVRAVERAHAKKLLSLLNVQVAQRVLEVGCGAGNVLARIGGTDLHGMDLSPSLLQKARARLGSRAELCEGWAEELPYPDASFDRVYGSELLEYVCDPEKVLLEMRRVVRPDGRVAVSVCDKPPVGPAAQNALTARIRGFLSGDSNGGLTDHGTKGEWCLHEVTIDAVRWITRAYFRVEATASVPTRGFALRHLVALRPI